MRTLVARALAPLAFRARGPALLFDFARTEQESVLELSAAANLASDVARRAAYLLHALDEAKHARMLSERSAELRRARQKEPFGAPRSDADGLFERLGEARFLAYVHRGEVRGHRQFEAHARAAERRGDAKTAAMFGVILADERRHMETSRRLLVEVTGGESSARKTLAWASAWESWRSFRRLGRASAALLFTIAMRALHLFLAPLALLVRVVRPARSGWLPAKPEATLAAPRAPKPSEAET